MSYKSIMLVGGTWSDVGGRPSSLVARMGKEIERHFGLTGSTIFNGGTFEALKGVVQAVVAYDAVVWMPNVSNHEEKLVENIKSLNPTALLVVSKRNDNDKYAFPHLVSRALKLKANMFIEICKGADGKFIASLYDSLSNLWEETDDFTELAKTLSLRVKQVLDFTRIRSRSFGPAKEIPDEPEFFDACREYGEKFHEMIGVASTPRFLGNIAFRCERGFPAFLNDGIVYVSRRNVDKRHIGREGFVAINAIRSDDISLAYYGNVKPSVDSPAQVGLFKKYANIRYMMHSHVYIKDAPMTSEAMPCGALEEYPAIARIFPDRSARLVTVNLRGHGSIVMADTVEAIRSVSYVSRPRPELQDVHATNLQGAKC